MVLVVGLFVHKVTQPRILSPKEMVANGAIIFSLPRELSAFSLVDQNGDVFTQEKLLNKWTLVFFGFTHCPDICPTTLALFNEVSNSLQETEFADDTQFLLENLKVQSNELKVLDVASGNGIIACEVVLQNSNAEVTLVDDFNLAIASSKINLKDKKAVFVCEDTLQNLPKETFDLVVSNPPFHFEHENNIEVTLLLFKGVYNCLHTNGRFLLVANSHLNYQTHLRTIFSDVEILKENKKFQILSCRK